MEEQGDLLSGEDGTEESAGFPQLRPVTSTPAPGLLAAWRLRAAYLGMQVSFGVKGLGGHNLAETGGLGPRDSLGKPGSWPQGLLLGAVLLTQP